MSRNDTKRRILDAAERLFAEQGFHHTSLRAITAAADANLAAVNYHFGSKDALIDAVLERRLVPLNEERSRNLRAVVAGARGAGRRPSVEAVLRAFLEPTLRFRDREPGARNFVQIVGRALFEPEDTVRDKFLKQVGPLFCQVREALGEALPHLPEETLSWRLQLAMGAMGRAMCLADPSRREPGTPLPPADTAELLATLLAFLAAGLSAP